MSMATIYFAEIVIVAFIARSGVTRALGIIVIRPSYSLARPNWLGSLSYSP